MKHFLMIAGISNLLCLNLPQTNAATINLDFVTAATAEDSGPQDGAFDVFSPLNYGSINNNGYESFRTAMEFSLSIMPADATIRSATLTLSANNFEGIRGLEVNGYAGDGVVELQDFSFDGLIGDRILPTGSSQTLVFDVTGFIDDLVGNGDVFAGFNLRENPPNDSNFTVFNIAMIGLDSPQVSIEFEPVPEPSVICLIGLGSLCLTLHNRTKQMAAPNKL